MAKSKKNKKKRERERESRVDTPEPEDHIDEDDTLSPTQGSDRKNDSEKRNAETPDSPKRSASPVLAKEDVKDDSRAGTPVSTKEAVGHNTDRRKKKSESRSRSKHSRSPKPDVKVERSSDVQRTRNSGSPSLSLLKPSDRRKGRHSRSPINSTHKSEHNDNQRSRHSRSPSTSLPKRPRSRLTQHVDDLASRRSPSPHTSKSSRRIKVEPEVENERESRHTLKEKELVVKDEPSTHHHDARSGKDRQSNQRANDRRSPDALPRGRALSKDRRPRDLDVKERSTDRTREVDRRPVDRFGVPIIPDDRNRRPFRRDPEWRTRPGGVDSGTSANRHLPTSSGGLSNTRDRGFDRNRVNRGDRERVELGPDGRRDRTPLNRDPNRSYTPIDSRNDRRINRRGGVDDRSMTDRHVGDDRHGRQSPANSRHSASSDRSKLLSPTADALIKTEGAELQEHPVDGIKREPEDAIKREMSDADDRERVDEDNELVASAGQLIPGVELDEEDLEAISDEDEAQAEINAAGESAVRNLNWDALMSDVSTLKAPSDSSVAQAFNVANVLRSLPISASLLSQRTRISVQKVLNETEDAESDSRVCVVGGTSLDHVRHFERQRQLDQALAHLKDPTHLLSMRLDLQCRRTLCGLTTLTVGPLPECDVSGPFNHAVVPHVLQHMKDNSGIIRSISPSQT